MDKLFELIEQDFDTAEGWMEIKSADWFSEDLRINLLVSFYEESTPQLWQISCDGVVEELICSKYAETVSVSENSPLLMPFNEPQIDLMFSKNEIPPAELLGTVLSICLETVGASRYLSRFLNLEPTIKGIVDSEFGLLGRFPEPIVKKIIEALDQKAIRLKSLNKKMPTYLSGSEHVCYPKLQALEIGKSYVIGTKFTAVQK